MSVQPSKKPWWVLPVRILLVAITIATAYEIWKLRESTSPAKPANNTEHATPGKLPTPKPDTNPSPSLPDEPPLDPSVVTTLKDVPLPKSIVTTAPISLLDATGKETTIPIHTTITVVKRAEHGGLTMQINSLLYVGNELRLARKAKWASR